MPFRTASAMVGRMPDRAPSSRNIRASRVTSPARMARNTTLTQNAAPTARGRRNRSFRNFTPGSAARARAVPSRKGNAVGSTYWTVSHAPRTSPQKRSARLTPGYIGKTSFRRIMVICTENLLNTGKFFLVFFNFWLFI